MAKILLVDDDTELTSVLGEWLESEGYIVESAENGEEALSRLSHYEYDVVVMDVGLPDMEGFKVCSTYRSRGGTLPVIMLTGRGQISDKTQGFESGADDYLTKPFAFTELVARIRALLRRGGPHIGSRLKAKDLEMDPASRRVWRGGKDITLTSKEFSLLEFLLRNRDIVLTRTAILERVWGLNYDPMTNVVDVYIRSLRVKIDRDFDVPLIATVRGVGYKLEAGE